MRRVARYTVIWWSFWVLAWAGGAVLVAFLWQSDKKPTDRIALIAVAMSVIGILIATVAAKWTREAVLIADRTLRLGILSEEMQRLEVIIGVIRESVKDASPEESASRLAAALGPFTATMLPRTFELAESYRRARTSDSELSTQAVKEVADALDTRRGARDSLTA